MSELVQDQQASGDQVDNTNNSSEAGASIDDKINAMEARWKSEIAGLNRRITDQDTVIKTKDEEIAKLKKESMSDKEKWEFDRQRQLDELKREKEEIENTRLQYQREVNKNKAMKILQEKELPVEFSDFVDVCSDETIDRDINRIIDIAEQYKSNLLKEHTKQNGVNISRSGSDDMPAKKFREMSITERQDLYRKDPALYKRLKEAP